jgi:hypothetical protein
MLFGQPEPAVSEVVGGQCHFCCFPKGGRSRLTGQLRYYVQD